MKKKNKNKAKQSIKTKDAVSVLENDLSLKAAVTESKDETAKGKKPDLEEPAVDDGNIGGDSTSEIAKLQLEVKAEVERRLRLMADYENYRKRTQSEYQRIYETAGERIILKLLPIIDDFQRFIDQDVSSAEPDVLKQGVELIYKKFMESMASENVKPIESIGKEFNVDLHEAIAQLEDEAKPDGTILADVERGYMMGTKVIRHPKVVVNSYSAKEVKSNSE